MALIACGAYGEEAIFRAFFEERLVGQRARGNDALNAPLYGPLACCRIPDLFAYRHGDTQAHEPREIPVYGVIWPACHGDGFAGGLTAMGEGDVQKIGCALSVAVEQLVKIPHPIEQQFLRMLGLDAQILLHHRCVAVELGSHGFPGGVQRAKRGSESSASKERQPAGAHAARSESRTVH